MELFNIFLNKVRKDVLLCHFCYYPYSKTKLIFTGKFQMGLFPKPTLIMHTQADMLINLVTAQHIQPYLLQYSLIHFS